MMNVSRIVVMLFVVGIIAAHANETNLTLTLDGVTYSNVTFGTVTTSSVYIHHRSGITRLPLAKLPMELQERFGYEPTHEATKKEPKKDEAVTSIYAPRTTNDTWLAAIKADPLNYMGKVVTIIGCLGIDNTYYGEYSDSSSSFYSLMFHEALPSGDLPGQDIKVYLSKKVGKPLIDYLVHWSGECKAVKIIITHVKSCPDEGPGVQAEVAHWCWLAADRHRWGAWETGDAAADTAALVKATAEQDGIRARAAVRAAARAEYQAAQAKAEAKAETEKVIEVKFLEVFNLKSKSDGTYSANITMIDKNTKRKITKLVLFNEDGLGFMRRRLGRSGKVYAVEIEANVTNIYGAQTDDTALYIVSYCP